MVGGYFEKNHMTNKIKKFVYTLLQPVVEPMDRFAALILISLSLEWGPSTAKRLGKAAARLSCSCSSDLAARLWRQGSRLTRYGRHLAGRMCRASCENRVKAARTHRAGPFFLISLYSSTCKKILLRTPRRN